MSAHTIGTCYEMVGANFEGQKVVTGEFTGTASYDSGGSVLDLSSQFSDEVRGGYVTDRTGEFIGQLLPTATTNLAATTKVLVRGYSWDLVTVEHDDATVACFDAAATTDNDTIWTQPANTLFLGCTVAVPTLFVAPSMTALTLEIGDAGNQDGYWDGTLDLVGATAGDSDSTFGVEAGDWNTAFKASAGNIVCYTSATGANLSTTTAGQMTAKFYFTGVDSLTGLVSNTGQPEVHSGQVLSGTTFTFIAWGTDA